MRRISAKYARPGMVLSLPVYDNYGNLLLYPTTRLDEESIQLMLQGGVSEILLEDWRTNDVPIVLMFSPELEGRLTRAYHHLVVDNRGKNSISRFSLDEVQVAIVDLTRNLGLESIGELNATGCIFPEDYIYVQPVKTAIISMAIGHKIGLPKGELIKLGMAAVLKDVGYLIMPPEILNNLPNGGEEDEALVADHPVLGYKLLSQSQSTSGDVARAVLQHHEHWDGSGYPQGLRGEAISHFAQIIAIADKYSSFLLVKPGQSRTLSHEIIEYIMAYSGEMFKPDLVEVFVRQIPCYPSGLSVELNTKERGIVSDPNLGFIGRPVVRICYNSRGLPVNEPYDINLSSPENQHKLITRVLEYD